MPAGCGKSTFLKTLNRMNDLVPNVRIEGDVRLRGEDIFSKEMQLTDLRRRVGMVFQKANPFPMSIYDNITYGPKLHGVRNKAELDELVESSLRGAALWDEVKDRLKKSALGLSGGQHQRAGRGGGPRRGPGHRRHQSGRDEPGVLPDRQKAGGTAHHRPGPEPGVSPGRRNAEAGDRPGYADQSRPGSGPGDRPDPELPGGLLGGALRRQKE